MKKNLILILAILISSGSVFAIENTQPRKAWYNFFTKEKNEVKLEKTKKNKRVEVVEIEQKTISSFKKEKQKFITMSIDKCVNFALAKKRNIR